MTDAMWIALSLASGLALGAFFFGGLWWTVSRLPVFDRPALMMVCSLLLRTVVTVAGFFLVSSGHGLRLLACLAGFALVRLVSRWTARVDSLPARKERSA
jgi:F1F0 ATPase subunit 2